MAPLYLEGGSFVGLGIHIALKFQRRTKEKNKTKDKGSQIHREEEKKHYIFTMDQSNHVFCVNKRFGLEWEKRKAAIEA